tara:strand:- start:423 stop:1202 length:780 start_codon:yes stop_codon:yes gene_type:complete
MIENRVHALFRFKQRTNNQHIVEKIGLKHRYATKSSFIRFVVNLVYKDVSRFVWISKQKQYIVDISKPLFTCKNNTEWHNENTIECKIDLHNCKEDNLQYVFDIKCMQALDDKIHKATEMCIKQNQMNIQIRECLPDTTYVICPFIHCITHNTIDESVFEMRIKTNKHPICSLLYICCTRPIVYVNEQGKKTTSNDIDTILYVKRNSYIEIYNHKFKISDDKNHAALLTTVNRCIFYELSIDTDNIYIFDNTYKNVSIQ